MEKVKTLVLSGGGVKCMAFIGAIRSLEEHSLYDHDTVETLAGTSGGAIVAVMLAAGYSSKEIEERASSLNISELQQFTFAKLSSLYGLDSGYGFIIELEKWLENKGYSKTITLKKFYEMTKKNLYIVTTCVNKMTPVYLNHSSHPDLMVVHAMRMSISIPFIFTAVKYKNDLYADGGLLDNFPITLFGEDNKHLLGLNLNQYINCSDINLEINSPQEYIFAIMTGIHHRFQTVKIEKYKERIIQIDSSGYNTFDFNLHPERLQKLTLLGYDSVTAAITNHSSLQCSED